MSRTGRTGPSQRMPQPHSEVFVQRAPERLLERLLEAPVACAEHRPSRHVACFFADQQTARTCRLSAARKLVSGLGACTGSPWQGAPRTPAGPAATRQHTLDARRCPCAQSAAAPASTGRAQAPLHLPLRGAGPGVELKAQLLHQPWTCVRPCCAVAYGTKGF